LTKTTELPAPTLLTNCYNQMFYGCSSLNYLKVGFTKWSPSSATSNWLEGVSAEGTFVCPSSLSVEYGAGKIPESWTVTNE
jgi:hypothetical protein